MSSLARQSGGRPWRRVQAGTLQTGRAANGTYATSYTTEFAGGVKHAMVELAWSSYETSQGVFSTSYVSGIQTLLTNLRAAGMKITLGLGIHYPPSWVTSAAGSQMINQAAATNVGPNWVFDQRIRNYLSSFYTRVHADFDVTSMFAIRLHSMNGGEVLYPDDATNTSFWAYDASAQNGANQATGLTPCPFPGWKPGQTTITLAQVQTWVDWYVGAQSNFIGWQRDRFDALGFTGMYHIITPGSGTRPTNLATDVTSRLTNASFAGVGAVWHKMYQQLPNYDRTMVYCSSVGDGSGSPADNLALSTDRDIALTDAQCDNWSAARWMARIAVEYGMVNGGENPGYVGATAFLNHYKDTTSAGLMAISFAQARSTNMQLFYWAHDLRLFDGTVPFSTYTSYINA